MTQPREVFDLNSGRPFRNKAQEYLDNGWQPMPLPEKAKFPPPTGRTGRNAEPVEQKDVDDWKADESIAKANLGVHLNFVDPPEDALFEEKRLTEAFWVRDGGPRWTVVGIDVDDYSDESKSKSGGKVLAELEEKLGKLPATWTSSSRGDGVSGIRFFLAPTEYSYRGQVGPSIECIQEVHRYAVVWPSAHPTAGQYTWFPPGQRPKGAPRSTYQAAVTPTEHLKGAKPGQVDIRLSARSVPSVWFLPTLPKKWVEHLSQGFTGASDVPIDMDVSVDEIYEWAKKSFKQKGGPSRYGPEKSLEALDSLGCSQMRKRVSSWKEQTAEQEDSHYVLTSAHWNLFRMGLEGHAGWMVGVRVLEDFWMRHVLGDPEAGGSGHGKRGQEEAVNEIFRSRTNALRKIKADVDKNASEGRNLLGRKCACYEGDGDSLAEEGDSEDEKLVGAIKDSSEAGLKDPGEYERNDDGNGQHFCDLYQDRFKYVLGYDRWIFWNSGANPGWQWAEKGLTRRAFRKVKIRQQNYARQLLNEALVAAADDTPEAKALKAKANAWNLWSERSGNNSQARGALESATENKGVALESGDFDSMEHLIGVANGVLELRDDGIFHRKAKKEDMVVTNTGVPYFSMKEILSGKAHGIAASGGAGDVRVNAIDMMEGARLWAEFLDLFLPNMEDRLWVQQMLGMCLIGGNPSKRFIFLHGESHTGKSTILNLIMAALGEYAGSAELSIFENSKLNPALAQALPWRVLTTTEANALGSKGLEGDMLKRLTGNDPMSAELKGVNEIIRRKPSFTPIVATNTAPQIDNLDEALRERVEVLPFNVRQDPNEAPVGVEERMRELSLPAVLSWMVDGWVLYAKHRLRNRPSGMIAAKEAFGREMSGDIGQFMEDCLVLTGNIEDTERIEAVYQAYKGWARQQNIQDNQVWSKIVFGRRMAKAGYRSHVQRIDGKSERVYRGVQMNEDLRKTVTFRVEKT